MRSSLGLVVVGIGLMGKRHVEAIEEVESTELIGIVDPSDEARSYAKERDVSWYPSLPDLFAANRPGEIPDGVIVATPTPCHVEHGLDCVAQGIPLLIEKPLATSAMEARLLIDAAEAAGVPLLVGHHRRYNPLIQKAREVIEAGEIGQIRAVHSNCWFYKPDHYFDQAPWRKKKGAGPISVNLVHDIDLIRHLCGEVTSVQAQAAASMRGFENEDVASALLTFENGAIGTITVADSIVSPGSWELTAREHPIYPSTSQSCYMIGGTHGSLSVPDLTLWRHEGARDWWAPINASTLEGEMSNPLVNQISHFAAVVEGKESPLVCGDEGLKALQVVEAIQTAAARREPVVLADVSGRSAEIPGALKTGGLHSKVL